VGCFAGDQPTGSATAEIDLATGEQRWQCGRPDPRVNVLPQKLAHKDVDFVCGIFATLKLAASIIIVGRAVLLMKHARNDVTQPIEGAA
jgi:hypothetical protein